MISSATIFYLFILLLLPFQWYQIGVYKEIFPALDLIIVYYLSTHKKMTYFYLFVIGLMIDQLYCFPIGLSSITLIISHFILLIISKWLTLKDYVTNVTMFCLYSVFVTGFRYLLITIGSTQYMENNSIYFYLLTTIFAYPVICFLIEKPIKMISSVKNHSYV